MPTVKLVIFLLLLSKLTLASVKETSKAPSTRHLSTVRQQIDSLKKEIVQQEGVKKQAQVAIEQSQKAILRINQTLQQLSAQQTISQRTLKQLKQKITTTQQAMAAAEQNIARLLRQSYERQGHQTDKSPVLLDEDENQTARYRVYEQYILAAEQGLISELQKKQTTLNHMTHTLLAKLTILNQLSERKALQKTQLEEKKTHKEQMLEVVKWQIKNQQQRLVELKENETRLSALIDRLNKQSQQRRRIAAKNNAKTGKFEAQTASSPLISEVADYRQSGKAFKSLQGQMKLPVIGEIAGQFGEKRAEGTAWKGLFIRTQAGSAVHCVADGRIVYAAHLRGFGQTMIVDHGGHYLTVYTGLSTFLTQQNQPVKAGQKLGLTGSLSNGDAGLYFEIRHLGQPLDPLVWVGKRAA